MTLSPATSMREGAASRARRLIFKTTQGGLLSLLLALMLTFTLLVGAQFLALDNLQSMAFQLPELGILSLAMMISLLHGGVNLSLISTANLSSLTIAYVLTTMVPGSGGVAWGIWQVVAICSGLVVAALVGLINGAVIAYLRVSPILATLGTMIMVKGIAIGLTHGTVISDFPAPIVFIGSGTVFGIPFGIILFGGCAALFSIMLNRTPFGAAIYLMGSNEQATAFSGVDTKRVILKIYVISSLLAAVAGVVMMARFNSANASYGESYLLATILAAVLGGVDPYGGFGKVSGLILSLVILQVISSAFNQLGLSQFMTLAIWGSILIAVSAVAMWRGRGVRR
ncbi:ABC transporter permease [Labrys wisconsinensis]|uniref:Ribose/xylose/arabinose/galactoside ABC-type transport system permease subunit n=1 Tax=Labrys wisconsinensis TaxID=425677 RepID=A0ABU0JAU4_9HYPH|nr:ABC transporter permease [Labrys wisconsinensis]MDQ0471379.1 ribose/xylose/arabinose/galactoside ABC-type transport system permease subunit [Labrys wisconsinensis]